MISGLSYVRVQLAHQETAPALGPSVCCNHRPWDMAPPSSEAALVLGPRGPQPSPPGEDTTPKIPWALAQQADTRPRILQGYSSVHQQAKTSLETLSSSARHSGIQSHLLKSLQITNFEKDMEKKGILVYCWWECKLVQPLWKTVCRFLTKLKIELPYDTTIPCLGIYFKKMKTLI